METQRNSSKTVLVTGGAGFIGSNFIRYWLEKYPDDIVVNFDLLTYAGNRSNLDDIEGSDNYTFIQGDIRVYEEVEKAMQNVDWVVHFAAESHVDRSVLGPVVFSYTNVVGTHNLLEAARHAGVERFHHVSTDEVYGALSLEDTDVFNEQRKYSPNSAYSASKAGSDHIVQAYATTYGLHTTITNTSNNIGPYQYPEKVVPLFITNAMDDEPLPIYGDGKSVRDYLHVYDHCTAIDLVLHGGTAGETYCVGGDSDVSITQLAQAILHALEKPESLISYVDDRAGHDRRYAIDSSKIKQVLGWSCHYDFNSALQQTVAWYQENESWWREIKDNHEYQQYYDKQYGERLNLHAD